MSSKDTNYKNRLDDSNKFLNKHNVMMGFAIIFLILAFVWAFCLSGVQTGSSTTSGFGSVVLSSQDEGGTVNSTYEVVAEFFIILFLFIGVYMLSYILTLKSASGKLIGKGQTYAAIVINGSKDVNESDFKKMDDASKNALIDNMGMPTNIISKGWDFMRNNDGYRDQINKDRDEYNNAKDKFAGDEYKEFIEQRRLKKLEDENERRKKRFGYKNKDNEVEE